jgi:hypothetical protein
MKWHKRWCEGCIRKRSVSWWGSLRIRARKPLPLWDTSSLSSTGEESQINREEACLRLKQILNIYRMGLPNYLARYFQTFYLTLHSQWAKTFSLFSEPHSGFTLLWWDFSQASRATTCSCLTWCLFTIRIWVEPFRPSQSNSQWLSPRPS